jgi:DnaJ-domain-containing protein 1
VWAICKHIEALRGQQRWGVGSIEQAFRGYMAIPERTSGSAWWNVLGVTINATPEQVQEAYRAKAKLVHPDLGGTDAEMAQVNLAYEEAQAAANGAL